MNDNNTFIVKEQDEAKFNFSDEKGVWQPKPEDILSLFEKLAQGKPLTLKWTCPGRRPPDKTVKSEKTGDDSMDEDDSSFQEKDLKHSTPIISAPSTAPESSAFDFNEPHVDVNAKLIPKRTPGGLGRTPKTEKRVARMDNIMNSLHKQQLQRAAEREARKARFTPTGTPNRSRMLNFGPEGFKYSPSGSPGFSRSVASSPRAGGTTGPSSLFNRGPLFTTVRKMSTDFDDSTKEDQEAQEGKDSLNLKAASPSGPQEVKSELASNIGQPAATGLTDAALTSPANTIQASLAHTSSTMGFSPKVHTATPPASTAICTSLATISTLSANFSAGNKSSEYVTCSDVVSVSLAQPLVPAPAAVGTNNTSLPSSVGVSGSSHKETNVSEPSVSDHLSQMTESMVLSNKDGSDIS